MNFENITRINYKNETFELNGMNVEEVLRAMDINRSSVTFEEKDGTLYIMSRTGTKGAYDDSLPYEYFEFSEEDLNGEYDSESEDIPKQYFQDEDGEFLEVNKHFTFEEMQKLKEKGETVSDISNDMPFDRLMHLKKIMLEINYSPIAEMLNISIEDAQELVHTIGKLI